MAAVIPCGIKLSEITTWLDEHLIDDPDDRLRWIDQITTMERVYLDEQAGKVSDGDNA